MKAFFPQRKIPTVICQNTFSDLPLPPLCNSTARMPQNKSIFILKKFSPIREKNKNQPGYGKYTLFNPFDLQRVPHLGQSVTFFQQPKQHRVPQQLDEKGF